MKKIFFDYSSRPHEPDVNGWAIFKQTSLAPLLPALQKGYSPPPGEVTIVVSHHMYDGAEGAHLQDVAEKATQAEGAFFFVYASRTDPAALRDRCKPAHGVFACHAEKLPQNYIALLQGQVNSNFGEAIAAINSIPSTMSVLQQAQAVRRILDKINGSVEDDEKFYSAIAMLLVRKALKSGKIEADQKHALKTWMGNRSDGCDTDAQIEEKLLNRFR